MKKITLLLLAILFLWAEEREGIESYLSVNRSLKTAIESEIEVIGNSKEFLREKSVNVLAKELVFSNLMIKKEYISSERDLFNSELFTVLKNLYKEEFKDLNRRLLQSRGKLESTQERLVALEKDLERISEKKERERKKSIVESGFAKIDSVIKMLSTATQESTDLTDYKTPVSFKSYRVNRAKVVTVDLQENFKVRSVFKGRVVFLDEDSRLGKIIIVKHPGEIFSVYGNLELFSQRVSIGEEVSPRTVLGEGLNRIFFKLSHGDTPLDASFLFKKERG